MTQMNMDNDTGVDRKRRLLIVTTVPGTLTTILRNQPRFLNNYFSVVLATSPGRDIEKLRENEGVETHAVTMCRGINPLSDLVSIFKMILLLRKLSPTIIHSYTPKAGLVSMLAGWVCRIPVRIHTFTGLIFPTQKGFKQKLLIWVDRLICLCATRVVPEGRGVKEDLHRFGITHKELQVIGHGNIAGVDTDYFSPDLPDVLSHALVLKRQLSIDNSAFVFCFVGRLNRDKGISELSCAFSGLPDGTHLILVGAHDEAAPVDATSMALLQSTPRVHFLGFQQDIRPALACSDVLILPSYREGFPNSILQAGAMRLPVIATDISGCNEVIEPNVNGWLVKPGSADALSSAMLSSLHLNEMKLKEMGCQARACIQSRFEQREHLSRMLNFYRNEISTSQASVSV